MLQELVHKEKQEVLAVLVTLVGYLAVAVAVGTQTQAVMVLLVLAMLMVLVAVVVTVETFLPITL